MTATIHFHLGLHKTGSTFFQRLLRINEDLLNPYVYILNRESADVNGLKTLRKYFFQNRFARITGDGVRGVLETLPIYQAFVSEAKRPLLLSDEVFSGFLPGQNRTYGLYEDLPHIIRCMDAATGSVPTRFHFMLREKDRWLASAYTQAVKQCRCSLSFEDYVGRVDQGFSWESFRMNIEDETTGITINWYNLEEEAGFAGQSILLACGVPESVLQELELPERLNESWPQQLVEIMRRVNEKGYGKEIEAAFRQEFNSGAPLFRQPSQAGVER